MKKWVFWFSLSKTRNFFLLNKYFWTSTYLLGYKIKSSDLFEIWRSYINCLSVIRAVSVKKAVFCDVKLCKLIDKQFAASIFSCRWGKQTALLLPYLPTRQHDIKFQNTGNFRHLLWSFLFIALLSFVHWLMKFIFCFRPFIVHLVYMFTNFSTLFFRYNRCLKHVILSARCACTISYQLLKIKIFIWNGRIRVFR